MKSNDINIDKGKLSRRDFTKKSIIAIAAVSSAGIVGYTACNTKKIKTINNVLRMGHCAPSIMQTLLDINNIQNKNMVLNSGAMAGGIAGANTECGALTAPIMFLGFRNKESAEIPDKLELISKAQTYLNEFNAYNGSSVCSRIRHQGMHACRKAMYNFHDIYVRAISAPSRLSEESKKSYSLLLKTFDENKFHCAHNVLNNIKDKIPVTKEMLDSTWLFIGGIAMLNRTCGALTAGVIALSSVSAKIEGSYSRVAKMNRLLRQRNNNALNEEINNFNRAINYSEELGAWFRNEFGTTSCRDLWTYDFSKKKDTENYISGQCMRQCRYIAEKVGNQVTLMI
ncbi:MAG TPA: C-GCAxxG-C-C family protein [Bacteroidales bacterium]|nr:C-GCAxxG-C-C family protein [Bacteroidales bacterium]